ncbi:MAG: hypothetical protein EOP06_04230 [Proteobacteria bacterium]|nr:MAG: hypothetical protein EOP06_04230 [Pseudomonadota bacterium]
MRWILFVTTSLIASLGFAQLTTTIASRAESVNQTIASDVLKVMGGCSERLWPGYDWNDLTLLLVADNPEKSLIVSVRDSRVQQLGKRLVNPSAFSSEFSFFEIDGSRWMSINTAAAVTLMSHRSDGEIAEDQFRLAVHEAFHNLIQPSWVKSEGMRGTELPILSEPRLLRSQLFHNLKDAFLNSKDAISLRRAKFWYQRWASTYTSELQGTTDGYEGSAKYVELLATALMKQSCDASDEEVLEAVKEKVRTEFGKVFDAKAFVLDAEGYEIGALGLFLAAQKNSSPDRYGKIAAGENPILIATSHVAPLRESISESVTKKFASRAVALQEDADSLVGRTLAMLNRVDHFVISIPQNWISGSVAPAGFFIDRASSSLLIPMAAPLRFTEPSGSSELSANKGAVVVNPGTISPCGQRSPWNYIAVGSIEVGAKSYSASTPDFNAALDGTAKVADGVTWFCAGE